MITIKGIDHVVFRTTKLDEMLHFYCDVLGCEIERRLSPDVGLVQLRAGNALIDLVPFDSEMGKAGGKAPTQDGRNVDHICLQIISVDEDELVNYLRINQVEHSKFATRYGAQGFGRSLYLKDPEGNEVELKPYIGI